MSVSISQTADDKIWVNGKLVIKDMNEKWIAQEELTPTEQKTFGNHIESINRESDAEER